MSRVFQAVENKGTPLNLVVQPATARASYSVILDSTGNLASRDTILTASRLRSSLAEGSKLHHVDGREQIPKLSWVEECRRPARPACGRDAAVLGPLFNCRRGLTLCRRPSLAIETFSCIRGRYLVYVAHIVPHSLDAADYGVRWKTIIEGTSPTHSHRGSKCFNEL